MKIHGMSLYTMECFGNRVKHCSSLNQQFKHMISKFLARHKLIHSFVLSLEVKSEHPVQEPVIFGVADVDENVPIRMWIDKGRVDNFVLIMPNKWDFMIRADRNSSRQYSFLESMDPENMIVEN